MINAFLVNYYLCTPSSFFPCVNCLFKLFMRLCSLHNVFFRSPALFVMKNSNIKKYGRHFGIRQANRRKNRYSLSHCMYFHFFCHLFCIAYFLCSFFLGGFKELFWTQKILVLLKTEKIPAIAKCFFSRILSSTLFQILLCVHYFITDSLPVLVVHERDLFEISKRKNSLKRAKKMWIFFFTVLYFSNGTARIYAAWSICTIICKMHRELCTIHQ